MNAYIDELKFSRSFLRVCPTHRCIVNTHSVFPFNTVVFPKYRCNVHTCTLYTTDSNSKWVDAPYIKCNVQFSPNISVFRSVKCWVYLDELGSYRSYIRVCPINTHILPSLNELMLQISVFRLLAVSQMVEFMNYFLIRFTASCRAPHNNKLIERFHLWAISIRYPNRLCIDEDLFDQFRSIRRYMLLVCGHC